MGDQLKDNTGSAPSVWDQQASSYDALRERDPVYSSCIHQVALVIPKGTNICLDAGSGTGLSTIALGTKCKTVVAVDYSLKSLEILRSRGLRNFIAVQGDLTSLPFKRAVFDACVSANTLQHLMPNGPQERAVAEFLRVTKENGIICISVHHYSKTKHKAGWIKEGKPGQVGIDYIFRFTRSDLLKLLPGSGIRGVGYYGLLRFPVLGRRLQNIVGRLWGITAAFLGYGHMLVAVAKNRYQNAPTLAGKESIN